MIRILLAIALALLLAGPAWAAPDDLVDELMVFAAEKTGLPLADPPAVMFHDRCIIHALARPSHPACPKVNSGLPVGAGVFMPGAVLLPDTWDADDVLDRSVLLHELVHHLQYEARMEMPWVTSRCTREELERPAYEAQIAYLKAHGVGNPLAALRISPLAHLFLTSCRLD